MALRQFRWSYYREETLWNQVQAHASLTAGLRPTNHARGSLNTVLHSGIWDKVGQVLERSEEECGCAAWAFVCGRYFAKLVKVDAYPPNMIFPKSSINIILSHLEDFKLGGSCRLHSFDRTLASSMRLIARRTVSMDCASTAWRSAERIVTEISIIGSSSVAMHMEGLTANAGFAMFRRHDKSAGVDETSIDES
ncbi:uncharacterized protein CC84DRAFT_1181008 [Paraphaeosphaeria sporulosa]|uniref:Uncharacterized protein n=1 Tax=Paraphaeosphaeria sporulosa TaxID=1460663 RepID=A0A177BYJ8_9PLEO|nr:uncharacterized protein CC84DRAFT_1181008 [Paraphaeosphaeria sporulosa]OAG00226.1 hypothetical protein CC84DRAFT_1181008 [Paraphaeosphaeria sporulosa]